MGAADVDDLALDGDDLQAQQVVGGDAVFEAVRRRRSSCRRCRRSCRRAGRTGRGRRRNRRPTTALVMPILVTPACTDGAAVGVVDVEDLVHPHHADDDGVCHRQRAAGERGAGAARHDADAVLVAVAQHGGDLFGGFRQGDGEGGPGDRRTGRRSRTASGGAVRRSGRFRGSSARGRRRWRRGGP